MPVTVDQIIEARWIFPATPEAETLTEHALVVNEGRILDILPISEVHERYTGAHHHRLHDHILIPGLINAHTHVAMNLLRGVADDLPLMDWLNNHIWPLEGKFISDEFVRDGTQLAIAEMIRGGVTCFNDMYFFPESTAQIAQEAGMRAMVGLIVIDFPSAWAANHNEYFQKGLAIRDQYKGDPFIHTAFAPHAPYSVSDDAFKRIVTLVNELDIPVHIHLHETEDEINQSLEKYGVRPIERLHQLGLLSPNLIAVHMTHLLDEEIQLLQDKSVHIIHCPESNLKLASGFCPVNQLIRNDINVAIGTDGAASNNDLDVLGEIRTAALLAKGVAGDASALPAKQALQLATINAARALGIDNETGSIEKGKSADITAIHLNEIETLPCFDPISHLVYSAQRHQVTDVWIAGKMVLNNRTLTTLDIEHLGKKAVDWQTRLSRYEAQR